VNPGEETNLRAPLSVLAKAIWERPWLWATAAAVVAGAITTTYLLTRPDLERPEPDGGGFGWVVTVPSTSGL
jgi:hypothetical protein